MLAFRPQARSLCDAETMLLVDDGQAKAAELDALLHQGVRAHRARGLAGGQGRPPRLTLAGTRRRRQERDRDSEGRSEEHTSELQSR